MLPRPAPALLAVLGGALLFLWPAALNGYPIVFSDTGGFLEQALEPDGGWDKPWVYGPFLTPFHRRTTLWPAVAVQASMLSFALWMLLVALGRAGARRHLLLCAVLAALTAAPWFASTLMPDLFAPVTAIAVFALAERRAGAWGALALSVVLAVAIASHLAHLVLAAACLALLALLRRELPWRAALPLGVAVLLVVAGNAYWHGRPAVSPYGSVFALARLVANGSAASVIRRECPASGWHVCAWSDRLPTDSDDFLWNPGGPVWADGRGPLPLAPEAAAIVRETVLTEPGAVLRGALADTLEQLPMVRIGDTLGPEHLDIAVLRRIERFFGNAEALRFLRGRQARGLLPDGTDLLNVAYGGVLLLGLAATVAVVARGGGAGRFALVALLAVGTNAAVTGALSHPHHRYGARIAWLLVLAPVAALLRPDRREAPGKGGFLDATRGGGQ